MLTIVQRSLVHVMRRRIRTETAPLLKHSLVIRPSPSLQAISSSFDKPSIVYSLYLHTFPSHPLPSSIVHLHHSSLHTSFSDFYTPRPPSPTTPDPQQPTQFSSPLAPSPVIAVPDLVFCSRTLTALSNQGLSGECLLLLEEMR
jgi:hypothetical protein